MKQIRCYPLFVEEKMNVRYVPEWFQSGDLIVRRSKRTFAVSMTLHERRWRQRWRRLVQYLKRMEAYVEQEKAKTV